MRRRWEDGRGAVLGYIGVSIEGTDCADAQMRGEILPSSESTGKVQWVSFNSFSLAGLLLQV